MATAYMCLDCNYEQPAMSTPCDRCGSVRVFTVGMWNLKSVTEMMRTAAQRSSDNDMVQAMEYVHEAFELVLQEFERVSKDVTSSS